MPWAGSGQVGNAPGQMRDAPLHQRGWGGDAPPEVGKAPLEIWDTPLEISPPPFHAVALGQGGASGLPDIEYVDKSLILVLRRMTNRENGKAHQV